SAFDCHLVIGANRVAHGGRDDDVDLLFQPGRLRCTAGTGRQARAVDVAEAVADGEQPRDVEPIAIEDRTLDIGYGDDPDAGPIEIARRRSADIAESLQGNGRALQR